MDTLEITDETTDVAPDAAPAAPTEGGGEAPLTIEDGIRILKAVKVLAAADGLSGIERAGLRLRMAELGIPAEIQQEIEGFDAASVASDDALAGFPRGGLRARYLLIAAISVASVDGYSGDERENILRAAARLGISAQYIAILEASEKVARMVEILQDSELAAAWQELGRALLEIESVVDI